MSERSQDRQGSQSQYTGTWEKGAFVDGKWVMKDGCAFVGDFGTRAGSKKVHHPTHNLFALMEEATSFC